jgi:hypothetical protein
MKHHYEGRDLMRIFLSSFVSFVFCIFLLTTSCSSSGSDSNDRSLLFVARGAGMIAAERVEISTEQIEWFSDRPDRQAGFYSLESFLAIWHENDLGTSPPNAALIGANIDAIAILSSPVTSESSISFAYKIIEGSIPEGKHDAVSLFIDNLQGPTGENVSALLAAHIKQPHNSFYLANLIDRNTSPSLTPLAIGDMDLGLYSIIGEEFDITLSNVEIHGLNSVAGVQSSSSSSDTSVAFEGSLGGGSDGLELVADANIGIGGAETLSGTLSILIYQSILAGSFQTTPGGAPDLSSATVTFSSLSLEANTADLRATLDIESAFQPLLNQLFNQSDLLNDVLDQINTTLGSANTLQSLSQNATTLARQGLS